MVGADDPTISRARSRAAEAAARPAVLRAVYPAELDWSLVLPPRQVVLGRIEHQGVPCLPHPTVSRSHLAVTWDAGTHACLDLGSRNGSRVGGAALARDRARPLSDGDVIGLGDVLLVYEAWSGPEDGPGVDAEAIPGRSPAVRALRAAIARAAPDPSPVLIVGETGTGKEWISRELHRLSERAGPLVAVNCAALSPQLVESQLFGHLRGAFTGATTEQSGLFRAAEGGTLLLDEIGELPAELQPKLLRALQERRVHPVGAARSVAVDVRVIAATNRDLRAAVETGTFRRDLYARLALWELAVPPLRDRRGDLPAWLARLQARFAAERDAAPAARLTTEAMEAVLLHTWPDNLRGLERLVHELAASRAEEVDRPDLPLWLREAPGTAESPAAVSDDPGKPLPTAEEFAAAYAALSGNVRALARHFGRDRRQIYRWIRAQGLGRDAPGD